MSALLRHLARRNIGVDRLGDRLATERADGAMRVTSRSVRFVGVLTLSACATSLLLLSCSGADPLPGHVRAPTDVEESVRHTIEDYYVLRSRAAVSGDITPLYARHPRLAAAEDRTKGVNVEAFFVERIQSFNRATSGPRATDVTLELTWYEPLRVYVKDDAAVAFVHGLESWVGTQTKGEMLVRFDLRRAADTWMIERTDEWVLGERPPATPTR